MDKSHSHRINKTCHEMCDNRLPGTKVFDVTIER